MGRVPACAGDAQCALTAALLKRVVTIFPSCSSLPLASQAYFGGYVCANYAYLARVAGLDAPQLAALAANSFRASFLLDAAAKERHCADVAATLREWQARGEPGPGKRLANAAGEPAAAAAAL